MKRIIFSCLILSFFVSAIFAFDGTDVFRGTATSTDGEWTIASVVGTQGKNRDIESVWLFNNDRYFDFPINLLTLKNHYGWSYPSVCYNRQNDSFMIYHHCWVRDREDGGIYEFYKVNGEFSANQYRRYQIKHGSAKLFANDAGVFLVKVYGEWNSERTARNYKIYKVDLDNQEEPLSIPAPLKDIEVSPLNWDDSKENPEVKNHSTRDVFFTTQNGLVFLDADETNWYHYDCFTGELQKFAVKEDAFACDERVIKQGNQNNKILAVAFVVCVVLCLILVFLCILLCYKNKKKVTIEDLDLKDKNCFIFTIQETERSKISRDIHDSVIQDIRVIRLETENLDVVDSSIELQDKIKKLATECIVKLRNICYNLAPAELANHTDGDSSEIELVSIINTLAQQFSARTHVPCSVTVEENFKYPVFEKEKTQNIFRVVQEALTNIEKHSYATQVSIFFKTEMTDGKEHIVIYVTDDGIGISSEKLLEKMDTKEHMGLRSMKDRMNLVGGSIEFVSEQDCGMEVIIRI